MGKFSVTSNLLLMYQVSWNKNEQFKFFYTCIMNLQCKIRYLN